MLGFVFRCLSPAFYRELNPLTKRPSGCAACCHLVFLCLVLSLPTSIVVGVRLSAALAAIDGPAMAEAAVNLFPYGLELVLNDSKLALRQTAEAAAQSDAEDVEADGDELANEKSFRFLPKAKDDTYVCWEGRLSQWCATSPTLEPIRLELSDWIIDLYYLGAFPPKKAQPVLS